MYSKKELLLIQDKYQNKKEEINIFYKNIWDNLISCDNNLITREFITCKFRIYNSFNESFHFFHKNIKTEGFVLVEFNFADFLNNKKINYEISFVKKDESLDPKEEFILLNNITNLNLTTNQLIYFGELISFVGNIVENINVDYLHNEMIQYKKISSQRTSLFRELFSYKINFNMEENRKKYKKYFNYLTKEREEEELKSYFKNKKSFSFVHFDSKLTSFKFEQYNISFENEKILVNSVISQKEIVYRHFLKNSVFINDSFIENIDVLIKLFDLKNDDINIILADNTIEINEEDFLNLFNLKLIKQKVDTF
jgi:hypothetical protein